VLPDDLNWLDPETAQAYEEFADTTSTAQVNPSQFTNYMAKLAEAGGATIVIGTVDHISCDDIDIASGYPAPLTSFEDLTKKKVVSVTYTDKATSKRQIIVTSTVVLAAGPWTPTLLPQVHMSPLRAHSVTIKLKRPISAYCLFTDITLREFPRNSTRADSPKSSSKTISPEIYSRPNNEVYICSQGDFNTVLPAPTDPVEVSSQSCQEIIDAATSISDELRQGQVTSRRACYLPMKDVGIDNDPLVGPTDLKGLLLATRHSCWGIANAPATGKVISELIFDGEARCIDIGNLNPRHII
jgi:glycine/D-amino acid oxidase-like deaminating enzyme